MKTFPLAEAKSKLSRLVDRVAQSDEGILITRNGRPAAVLISPDKYGSLKETHAVQSDRELMREIRQGLREVRKGGRICTLEELMP
jgi:antitoxin YefM